MRFKLGTNVPIRNRTRSTKEVHLPETHANSARVAHVTKHKMRHAGHTLQELLTTTELILLNDSGVLVDDLEFPDPFALQIGGLRGDPFRMFPIESKGYVAEAFDYCKKRLR